MFLSSRRAFLGTSLGALAAGLVRADSPPDPPVQKGIDDPPFQPNTLFLTWQRDPTTTMTVQWVGTPGETADTKISYKTLKADDWETEKTAAKPYPAPS